MSLSPEHQRLIETVRGARHPEEACPLCGIWRQHSGHSASCGDDHLKPGCFLAQSAALDALALKLARLEKLERLMATSVTSIRHRSSFGSHENCPRCQIDGLLAAREEEAT